MSVVSLAPVAQPATEDSLVLSKPSFDEIYADHFDYVWQTARRLGIRDEGIDDVVQEAFLAVHRRLPEYEPRESLRGWLYGIVLRVVLHVRRRASRRGGNYECAGIEALPDPAERGPESNAAAREDVRLLEGLLDRLDAEKRAILILSELEGKSVVEIATILELNINTASSRLRAARELVRAGIARHRARDRWKLT